MSSRAEIRIEKQRTPRIPTNPWRAFDISEWILCFAILLLVMTLPWYYGCVQWKSQYILAWVGVVFCGLLAAHCLLSIASKSRDLSVPWLTWLFFFLGFVAFIQSTPIFSWQGNGVVPPSVQVQRWALGLSETPQSLQRSLVATTKIQPSDGSRLQTSVPCDLESVPETERNLAWSVEPLHTRGAVVSLLLCGLFMWVGRMVFSDPNKQLWLFGTLTLIGILIACVGIQGAVSYKSENFLGLRSGSSFATFVSKNSAGGFYNVCIAGCLGMLGWTLLNTQRASKDTRYRFPDTTIFSKIRGFAEDSLADLNTAQISSVLCLISIVAALLISLCRGAAVSALGAIIIAAFIANSKNQSRGGWVISVTVATAFVACMVGFQIDDKAYARLESLSDINLEEELQAGRAYIWSIAWKAMTFYGWLGSGLGTFHFAYLPFQESSSQGWYYHAESLYAQCGVELGYLGVSLLALAIIMLIAGLQKPPAKDNWRLAFPSKLAGTYLVISQALHSFVDFAIILPALFVPACVLMGSVQGTLRDARIAPARKRSRRDSSKVVNPVFANSTPWVRNGLIGMVVSIGCGLAISNLAASVRSLAVAESMVDWTREEEKEMLEEQTEERVREMAKIWASGDALLDKSLLKENSIAMRAFADSLLFEYRMNQVKATPPKSWRDTSPIFLQLALDREKDRMKKEQIVEFVGGQKAIDLLGKSASWYALGQTKSPLDWRLLWGRCLSNTVCDRTEVAKLLPASLVLAKHQSQQLLATSLLFRDQFDAVQFEHVLAQAMKSNPAAAVNSAKLLAREREGEDENVPIEIFPQRYDILETIASEKDTFTKERFPETNRQLWERARELVKQAPMTASRREEWLADSWAALGDIDEEIKHLQSAAKKEPNNIKLHCRLANRLLESSKINEEKAVDATDNESTEYRKKATGRINEAKAVYTTLSKMDSGNVAVKAIADRIKKFLD